MRTATPRRRNAIFGDILKKARQAAAMSQEGLALEAGLTRAYISKLERGLKEPGLATLLALGPALGTTAHELVKSVEKTLHRK